MLLYLVTTMQLFHFHVSFAVGPFRTACGRSGNFVASNAGYSLSSANVLATKQVRTSTECAIKCMWNNLCQSYNYQCTSANNLHQCELLDTVKGDDQTLTARVEYKYYEPKASPCQGLPCQNDGLCATDCLGNEFCACTPSYTGIICQMPAQPSVEIHPVDQGVIPNNTTPVMLNCFSKTADSYAWYKDNVVLDTSSGRINILPNGSLEIVSFTAIDNGLYNCEISNIHGSNISKSAQVEVLGPPGFRQYIFSMIITVRTYFDLKVYPNKFVEIDSWYKDGVEIDFDTVDSSPKSVVDGKLIFHRPLPSDTGIYKVKLSNAVGTTFSDDMNIVVLELCPRLNNPINGWRHGTRAEGDVLHFQCHFKYTMVGGENLVCQPDGTWNDTAPTCTQDTSNNHPVRLTGSTNDNEGVVEIFSGGRWGAVGHQDWDINDATVVCRQLGFPAALRAYNYSAFGVSSGPIHFTNVLCTGNEFELAECTASPDTAYCSHNKTAGVLCQNLRLVDGGSSHGRLEVYTGGRWGTVCDDFWTTESTHVACLQLGLGAGLGQSSGVSQGTGDIALDDVICHGRESSLLHCSHMTTSNCAHSEDISIECNTLRIAGSASYREGRVEVYENSYWGTVCDDEWDINDAKVVCKQLGFSGALLSPLSGLYGSGTGDIIYDDVACTGDEISLGDCTKNSEHNCAHSEDAGVVCEADVRLEGSNNYYEGRVEVFKDGSWGTICDWLWDMNAGEVFCRMLGFNGAVQIYGGTYFGAGSGTIHYDGLQCDGTEHDIKYCPKNPLGTCTHNRDAGVRCQIFRLAGSMWTNQGRVELYKDNEWGTLCDNPFAAGEAQLICLQIGRSAYGAHISSPSIYGEGKGLIHMSYIDCVRTEDSIFDCKHSTSTSNCSHANDISLRCNSGARIDPGIVGGVIRSFRHNTWGRVCANQWDQRDAEVTCRELTFPLGALKAYQEPRDASFSLTRAGLHCDGYETSLADCRQEVVDADSCSHDAAVVCQDLRLIGPTHNEGRLEVYRPIGNWGSICSNRWDMRDADVACHQLGFLGKAEITYLAGSLATVNRSPVLAGFYCVGVETSLHECAKEMDFTGCTPETDVWVKCVV